METAQSILNEVKQAGLSLHVDGDYLKIEPREKITSDIRAKLVAYKSVIIAHDAIQKVELKELIHKVGKHYKATDAEIEEMFVDTLIYHSLETALTTFRNLANQMLPVNNRKKTDDEI